MIIRNFPVVPAFCIPTDNRQQTTDHGPLPTYLNFKPCFYSFYEIKAENLLFTFYLLMNRSNAIQKGFLFPSSEEFIYFHALFPFQLKFLNHQDAFPTLEMQVGLEV